MDRRKQTIAFAVLAWSTLFAIGVGSRAYASAWLDGTPYFYEEAQSLVKVLGHGDGVMLAPALADRSGSPVYKIGDEREFYATNMLSKTQYSLKASLYAVSDKAYIFVQNGRPADSGKIKSLLAAFNGTYDTITKQFGPPPDSIDGDPRIYILIMDIIDGVPANGTRMVGYFSPIDQYRNIQLARWTDKRSNEVEMLYIDYIAMDILEGGAESVVAHEFTHLVQWARDPAEPVWINEGIAVYVEAMLGYEVESRISAFEEQPDTPLLDWSGSIADYGAAYLFFAYVSERFGGIPAIAAIVKNRDQGIKGIEGALATQGKSVSFDKLFSDWIIANYLDDPNLKDGIYGYSSLDVHLKPCVVESQYPITHKTSKVKPWAARYIEFKKEQDDALNLTVYNNDENDNIVAQIIEISDGILVSSVKSSREKSGDALVPRENSKIVLVVSSQPDPLDMNRVVSSSYTYSADTQAVIAVEPNRKITTWGRIKHN